MGKEFPIYIWPLTWLWILLVSWVLTSPFTNAKKLILHWFRSDLLAFIFIILSSLSFVVILAWLHLFANFLVLFSAAALARLDLQTSGYKKQKAFTVLSLISLVGLGLGVGCRFLFYYR